MPEDAMDIVFPQYYEWHSEMEKLCRVAGLNLQPEEIHEAFRAIDDGFRAYLKRGYSEEIPNPYKKQSRAFWGFAFSPVLLTRQLGAVAYFKTLESSADFSTSRLGEHLIAMLFLKFFAERFAGVVRKVEKEVRDQAEKAKKRKNSKHAKK